MIKWTMKNVRETDDITFAISILNERKVKLKQGSHLLKKVLRAIHTLALVRGAESPDMLGDCLLEIRRGMCCDLKREYIISDIRHALEEEQTKLNLHGVLPIAVLADAEMIERAYQLLICMGKGEEYWVGVKAAIENGVRDILEKRGHAGGIVT